MARKSRKNIETAATETITTSAVYCTAGYIRLSVEDNKKKGDSIETQKAILENHIALDPELKLYGYYIDNGISGTTFERPQFKKMLADAESGTINCIIVKDLSRLGRNAIDSGYYIEKYLPALGCRFIAVNDDYDSKKDMDSGASVILPLKHVINEAYALDIGRKIKAQQRQAMKAGDYIGGRPPYGYLKAPDNCHKLIIDPVTAPTVRRIHELFLENTSMNNIVRFLNESGITTPSHYRKEIGLIKHENLIGKDAWQTLTVRKILIDEVYVGDMIQGKTRSTCRKQTDVPESEWIRVADTHEPILSREAFAQVQKRLKDMAEKASATPHIPYTPNIFKGKVFCGHCGGSMNRSRKQRKSPDGVYHFDCLSNKRKARGSCVPYIMPEKDLIQTLLTAIQSHAGVIIGKSMKLRSNQANIEEKRRSMKAELSTLRQESEKNKHMIKSLYESLVKGLITTDEYREMRNSYETKTRDNLARAAELDTWQTELDMEITKYCELSDSIVDAENSGLTAAVIECLVDRIRIFSDRSIEVDFKFDSGFGLINEVTDNE